MEPFGVFFGTKCTSYLEAHGKARSGVKGLTNHPVTRLWCSSRLVIKWWLIQNVWFQDKYHSCEVTNFHFTAVVCIVLLELLCGKDAFKADSQIALKINIEPQHLPVKILSILDIANLVLSLCPQNALCLRTEAKVTKLLSTHHYIHCWWKVFTGWRYSKLYSLLISVVMVW